MVFGSNGGETDLSRLEALPKFGRYLIKLPVLKREQAPWFKNPPAGKTTPVYSKKRGSTTVP